jgi:hypothetical protein
VPFTEDLTPFLADFGVSAVVGGVIVTGIFDNAFAAEFGFVAGSRPQLLVRAADVPSVAQGTAVTLPAGSYTVAALEPDGTGMLLLRLVEA